MSDHDLLNSAVSTGALFTATPLLTPNFSSKAGVLTVIFHLFLFLFFSFFFLTNFPFLSSLQGTKFSKQGHCSVCALKWPEARKNVPARLAICCSYRFTAIFLQDGVWKSEHWRWSRKQSLQNLLCLPLPKQKRGSSPQRRRSYHSCAKIQNLPLRWKR